MRTHKTSVAILALTVALAAAGAAQDLTVPNTKDSLKFAVIGDSGTGNSDQYRVAAKLAEVYKRFKFDFVVMNGDNMYGGESTRDFERKFETPYKPLLDAGVKFYASLGNHDTPNQRMYKPFNMGGERFYTFKPKDGVRFFALDSNYMDPEQLKWLEKELTASGSDWKIAFFHHPMYSSGATHGSDTALRDQLEPLFLKYGVDIVLSGHEHFYERLRPQKGIHYIILGNSGKVRRGDVRGQFTEKGFDQGFGFMIAEIEKDQLHFQTISDEGKTVDSGIIARRRVESAAGPSQRAAPPANPVPPQDKPGTASRPAPPAPPVGTSGTASSPTGKSEKPTVKKEKRSWWDFF